ncbi:adhesion G protein-coupled receptor L1 [Caerostris darwini]|uniref:Adhesion G protein-coupled receptor L1 n=1 Tax=Caerostris darwini TaxID=1538125 RepID=A0AAV4UD72_9ARAC|nr:adhesion G protein-coupled receptor L1 [Caerostris darwini]
MVSGTAKSKIIPKPVPMRGVAVSSFVNNGADAIQISLKLANETKHQSLSHGDITALVDLSTKILALCNEQNREKAYDEIKIQEKPLSCNFTDSMISSMSNMLRAEMKTAWEVLPEELLLPSSPLLALEPQPAWPI